MNIVKLTYFLFGVGVCVCVCGGSIALQDHYYQRVYSALELNYIEFTLKAHGIHKPKHNNGKTIITWSLRDCI